MEVDFTQWWVPAVTMIVLGVYVFYSGFQEYRMPAPVKAAAGEGGDEAAAESSPAPARKAKRGFLFRTSWLWGSVLIGAAAQVYLSLMGG